MLRRYRFIQADVFTEFILAATRSLSFLTRKG
jgi:hypothetical protein